MKFVLFTLFCILQSAPSFSMGDKHPRSGRAYPAISIDDLKLAISKRSVTIIDVEGPTSYKNGHIPTALSWSEIKDDLASHLPVDKNALIVTYSGNYLCSAYVRAAEAVKALGYTNVRGFREGMSGWLESGGNIWKR